MLTSFDICSTGEAMAFGDSGGYVHVWSDRSDLHVSIIFSFFLFYITIKLDNFLFIFALTSQIHVQ